MPNLRSAVLHRFLPLLLLLAPALPAHAFDIGANTGFLYLPNSRYSYLAFDASITFDHADGSGWHLKLGATPPFTAHRFVETYLWTSFGYRFVWDLKWFRPYVASTLGVFIPYVTGGVHPMATLYTDVGYKLGGQHFGFNMHGSFGLGLADFGQFWVYQVAWPIIQFQAGVYIDF